MKHWWNIIFERTKQELYYPMGRVFSFWFWGKQANWISFLLVYHQLLMLSSSLYCISCIWNERSSLLFFFLFIRTVCWLVPNFLQHLYTSFDEESGFFQFATSTTSNDVEEIQKFLDKAIDARFFILF